MHIRKADRLLVIGLSVAAGLLYNSWPFGYWLNPAVSKHSLASGLEAAGQPYNWVFIGGDVASSMLAMAACLLLWRRLRGGERSRLAVAALVMVMAFGVGTIVDALLPEHCVPGLQRCASFTHDHTLLLHGLFSVGASLALFISVGVAWMRQRYSVLLNGVLIAYILFGVVSLVQAVAPGNTSNWSQHYYITLCSVWLALIPYAFELMLQQKRAAAVARQKSRR